MEANINGTNYDTRTWVMAGADFTTKIVTPAATIIAANATGTASSSNNVRDWSFVTNTDDGTTPSQGSPAMDATYLLTNGSGELTENITQTDNAQREFKSFGVMNCTLTTIKMDCINWVVSAAGETAYKGTVVESAKVDKKGGYKRWGEGDSVDFYWFDGRDLSNAAISAGGRPDLYTDTEGVATT